MLKKIMSIMNRKPLGNGLSGLSLKPTNDLEMSQLSVIDNMTDSRFVNILEQNPGAQIHQHPITFGSDNMTSGQ